MKRLIRTVVLLLPLSLSLASSASATDFTFSAQTLSNFGYRPASGTTVELWLFLDRSFIASDGAPQQSGNEQNRITVKRVVCTVNTGLRTIAIPSFTLTTTTDGLDITSARYNAIFYSIRGQTATKIVAYENFSQFRVPASLAPAATCTPAPCGAWSDIRTFNFAKVTTPDFSVYTKPEVDAKIAVAAAQPVWGGITGTLSNQTDLQTALNAKEATANKGIDSGYAALDSSGNVIPKAGAAFLFGGALGNSGMYGSASRIDWTVDTGEALTYLISGGIGVLRIDQSIGNGIELRTSADAVALLTGVGGSPNATLSVAGIRINGAAASRKILVGNGTNFVASTETLAAPGTSGNVLTSDGTNWLSSAPAGSGITIGTTTITSGTSTRVLFNNAGVVGEYVITGTGNVVMSASPTLTGTVGLAALTATGTVVQTSASAAAFESGPNGSTNPVLRLVNSVASQATGLSITGNASGSGVTLTAISSGANESINLVPKGTGAVVVPGLTSPSGVLLNINSGSGSGITFLSSAIVNIVGLNLRVGSTVVVGWTAGGGTASLDTGISRLGAASVALGNGSASSFTGNLKLSSIQVGANLTFSATAPTIAAGFGTSPTVAGGSTSFTITVGTGGSDSTGTITFPTAATGWIVQLTDVTNNASFVTSQTGGSTTTATVQNYSRTTGLPIAWTAGDVLRCTAVAY